MQAAVQKRLQMCRKYPAKRIKFYAKLPEGCGYKVNKKDFKDYLKKYKLPQFAFAPDACFPVGISETGAIRLCWKTQCYV